MSVSLTFEVLEHEVEQLPPHLQLQLVARISEKLSVFMLNPVSEKKNNQKQAKKEQLAELDAWLAGEVQQHFCACWQTTYIKLLLLMWLVDIDVWHWPSFPRKEWNL